MELQDKIMSDVLAFRTYSKYLPHLQRREIFAESVNRLMAMHLEKFPEISKDITFAFNHVHDYKVLPSMRMLQYAGEQIAKNNCRGYNCSGLNCDSIETFGETLFLLLSGTGVGISVQNHHIGLLPSIRQAGEEYEYLVHDSIQGWAEAVDVLIKSYVRGSNRPIFNYSNIREKGANISSSGTKAPGYRPLKKALDEIESILKRSVGRKLKSVECADIFCHLADSVLSGGIRRAAIIILFDRDDSDMLHYKFGTWWDRNPQRALANISAVLPLSKTTHEEFLRVFSSCRNSGSGEPAFYWTNNINYIFNPCFEATLRAMTFCNLATTNMTDVKTKKEFLRRIKAAAIIATIQATYTEFPYLRIEWKTRTEEDSLIGVSMTGIGDNFEFFTPELLSEGASLVKDVNAKLAKRLGINPAKRCTVLKPEGSSSIILGSSSGIHCRESEYYIRRIRTMKSDPLISYFQKNLPDFLEQSFGREDEMIMVFPQKAPEGSTIRNNLSAIDLFNRILMFNKHWIKSGHREGDNFNNVSATITVKEDEWDSLREEMWNHREEYHGVSLLPFDGGTYQQAPFEPITKEKYEELILKLKPIDLRFVREVDDNTTRSMSVACSGGVCEISL